MDAQALRSVNLVGAITANAYFVLIIAMFALRLAGQMGAARWVGIASFLAVVPVIYLLVQATRVERPPIYYVWLGLFLLFLCAELVIDDILQLPFRSIRWATIVYVMCFFAATGGMIGVAREAGRGWTITTVAIYLVMGVLAFVQRGATGL